MTLTSYLGSSRAVAHRRAKFDVRQRASRGDTLMLLVAVLSLLAAGTLDSFAQSPVLNSLKANGQLTWTYGYNSNTNQFARLEISTNLGINAWTPFFYDFVSTNLPLPSYRLPVFFDPPTNAARSLVVPKNKPAAFFRTAIQNNIPDTNLVLHLTFNNDFSRGLVLDSSGYGNHGLRYGATNWPSFTIGPDGSSLAAEFNVFDATDPTYFGVGDYVSVLGTPSLDNLSQGTIMVWAHYYTGNGGSYESDSRATLIDTAYGDNIGSWSLGRENNSLTSFFVFTGINVGTSLYFPDNTATGNTGGWHYYVITYDGTKINGFFDAKPIGSISFLGAMTHLRVGQADADYIAIGTWTHGGTPQFNDDQYPNCCWMHGAIGDIRIYNRALSTNEITALFLSFDKQSPSIPFNLSARAAASNQIELRWTKSVDDFAVAGYTVRRNGTTVGTATGPSYVDTGLAAGSTNQYTVDAFDTAGNHSAASSPITTNTTTTAAVAVVIDDEDGPQRFADPDSWNFSPNVLGSYRSGFHFIGTVGKSVTYLPVLPSPGSYDVYTWYGGLNNGTPNYYWVDNVPIDIVHNGTTNTVTLNEKIGYGSWVYLGTFNFNATTNEFVRFRTDGTTGHGSNGTDLIGADAIMFTR